ncbi:hypothetical protein TEA_028368 [Camellia sinensis var. sinensis]|uniref:Uncharacterized protein n=1 Tax=Camellia sinensis var. sinensis TaxID=542762 RepID=A0A4S4DK58_CAMSN|nr:hypothetical protein TEA_028368 [Camellia sinensis var. sinensis]
MTDESNSSAKNKKPNVESNNEFGDYGSVTKEQRIDAFDDSQEELRPEASNEKNSNENGSLEDKEKNQESLSLLFIVNGERTGKLQALFLLLYFPKANGERTGKLQALFLLLYFPKATKRIFLFEKGYALFPHLFFPSRIQSPHEESKKLGTISITTSSLLSRSQLLHFQVPHKFHHYFFTALAFTTAYLQVP